MHRRRFLATSAAAATSLAFASRLHAFTLPPDHTYMKSLGLQLYTLRNQLAEDQAETIAAVAKAGYYQVELMDVLQGAEIFKVAKDNGLAVTSSFFDWNIVVAPENDGVAKIDDVIAKAQEMQLKYLVFGYVGKGHRETADHYRKIADSANKVGEKIKSAGMQMHYHNHSFEFEPLSDDTMGFEILMERFDPKLVNFELDVFWVAVGGWNPVEMLRKLDKRAVQLHLKDVRPGTGTIYDEGQVPKSAFQEVGDGSIMFRDILQLAEQLGVVQCHVEQDQSPAPLESICQSYSYLQDMDP